MCEVYNKSWTAVKRSNLNISVLARTISHLARRAAKQTLLQCLSLPWLPIVALPIYKTKTFIAGGGWSLVLRTEWQCVYVINTCSDIFPSQSRDWYFLSYCKVRIRIGLPYIADKQKHLDLNSLVHWTRVLIAPSERKIRSRVLEKFLFSISKPKVCKLNHYNTKSIP